MKKIISLYLLIFTFQLNAQTDRWQQRVEYKMDVNINAKVNQYTGNQSIKYYNNSPDTLTSVFFHLYLNAFQPGSVMDVRSRNIEDPDKRVSTRIAALKSDEIGYENITSFKHDGEVLNTKVEGTILEVKLKKPILPKSTATFELTYDAQMPLQIRRNGRDNAEGVRFSMAQWYPKLCEYDYQGWHANPYVGREFYGVWGDFDVKITIDKDYVIGGTGYLQNPNEIGYGYETPGTQVESNKSKTNTWHFKAENVFDFAFGADPDYTHTQIKTNNGVTLHFFYQKDGKNVDEWKLAPAIMKDAFEYICKNYGEYPYKDYSFVQAGDGGMEYPMATLITGNRPLRSLVGVSVHELIHSWYQGVLGTNESLHAWMDEGFTSYASDIVMEYLVRKNHFPGVEPTEDVMFDTYNGYFNLANSGKAEPMTTHADHFKSNMAYSISAYVYGAVFIHQMEYIVGKPVFDRAFIRYYNDWKFKHPNPNDLIRIFEKESGLELDWYKEYFAQTNNIINYKISEINNKEKNTEIVLERVGYHIMPVDVAVTTENGKISYFTIPLDLMRGEKTKDYTGNLTALPDWQWTNTTYTATIPIPFYDIKKIEIDPTKRLADIDPLDNVYINNISKPSLEEGDSRGKFKDSNKDLKKANKNMKEAKE